MRSSEKNDAKNPVLSIITPAFNEARNLPLLYARLKKSLDRLRLRWEWIVIDDHSADETFKTMEIIARKDQRVKAFRFAKNSGSHLALAFGLKTARGRCAAGIAADLQDPPELIGKLLMKWRAGSKIVWAVRSGREGESFSTIFFSRLYYFLLRYGVGLKQVPPAGADFFLLDRAVLDALAKSRIENTSLLLLISSIDVTQGFITYTKRRRVYGTSGWSLWKKLKLVFYSVTMFSKVPIYWLIGLGIIFLVGSIFEKRVGLNELNFEIISILLGVLMLVIGSYFLWVLRAKAPEPIYLVKETTKFEKTKSSSIFRSLSE